MGASPSAQTEGGAPALLWKSIQNSLSAPLKSAGEVRMGNHKGGSRESRFAALVAVKPRAGDEHRPEALFAGIDTAPVILCLSPTLYPTFIHPQGAPFQGSHR